MHILIMGGTQFLGRAIVEAAAAAGHQVTLFNRGKTNPHLFQEHEQLRGDRKTGDLSALKGRSFDRIIDVNAYYPRVVRELLEAVDTEHYTLISTLSVYAGSTELNQDESAPLADLDDETTEDVTGETYGGLKVLCEKEATARMDGRALLVRSGLIVGPHDPTDRFTYWPVRVARGGAMLAPGDPSNAIQVIDVRDEAEWVVRAAEQQLTGAYNVTGSDRLTFEDVLLTSKQVSHSDARFIWASQQFMLDNDVKPYVDVPLWVTHDVAGFHHFNIDKARQAGLTFRPIATTIADTLAWYKTRPDDYQLQTGMSAERERELLQKLEQQEKE